MRALLAVLLVGTMVAGIGVFWYFESNQADLVVVDKAQAEEQQVETIDGYETPTQEAPVYSLKTLQGDFFGDGLIDSAKLEPDSSGVVQIVIYNGEEHGVTRVVVGEATTDYSWAGEFETVPAGEPLWASWGDEEESDLRELSDVPEDEIVRLAHEAIYVHAASSWGGAFIYWKEGKWASLPQE